MMKNFRHIVLCKLRKRVLDEIDKVVLGDDVLRGKNDALIRIILNSLVSASPHTNPLEATCARKSHSFSILTRDGRGFGDVHP